MAFRVEAIRQTILLAKLLAHHANLAAVATRLEWVIALAWLAAIPARASLEAHRTRGGLGGPSGLRDSRRRRRGTGAKRQDSYEHGGQLDHDVVPLAFAAPASLGGGPASICRTSDPPEEAALAVRVVPVLGGQLC